VEPAEATDVLVTSKWDDAEAKLAAGGKVLYLPLAADLDAINPKMTTVPTFWNRLMNPGGAWMLGLLCDAQHPALAGFPTEANCDWQWIDLAGDARALNLDALPAALEPLVQPIDDWNRNWKLGLIYECKAECKVGTGRLLVCSIDLETKRAGAASLRRSLLEYMGGERFQPNVTVAVAELRKALVRSGKGPATDQPAPLSSPDLADPGQIHRNPAQ